MNKLIVLVLILLTSNFVCSQSNKNKLVDTELISEIISVKSGNQFQIAIKMKIKKGWYSYWLNPGDAGMPAEFQWDLPAGFSAGPVKWPYPGSFETGGLVSFGYEGEVLLPVEISIDKNINAGEYKINLQADYLICKTECIPESSELSMKIIVSDNETKYDLENQNILSENKKMLPLFSEAWLFQSEQTDTSVIISGFPKFPQMEIPDKVKYYPYEQGIFSNSKKQKYKTVNRKFTLEVFYELMRQSDPDSLTGVIVSSERWDGTKNYKALKINIPIQKSKQ